jgi:hypothetical protein
MSDVETVRRSPARGRGRLRLVAKARGGNRIDHLIICDFVDIGTDVLSPLRALKNTAIDDLRRRLRRLIQLKAAPLDALQIDQDPVRELVPTPPISRFSIRSLPRPGASARRISKRCRRNCDRKKTGRVQNHKTAPRR